MSGLGKRSRARARATRRVSRACTSSGRAFLACAAARRVGSHRDASLLLAVLVNQQPSLVHARRLEWMRDSIDLCRNLIDITITHMPTGRVGGLWFDRHRALFLLLRCYSGARAHHGRRLCCAGLHPLPGKTSQPKEQPSSPGRHVPSDGASLVHVSDELGHSLDWGGH